MCLIREHHQRLRHWKLCQRREKKTDTQLSEELMQTIDQGKPKDITPAVAGKVGYNKAEKHNLE